MAHIHQIPALRKSRDLYFSGGCLFVRQLCFCGAIGFYSAGGVHRSLLPPEELLRSSADFLQRLSGILRTSLRFRLDENGQAMVFPYHRPGPGAESRNRRELAPEVIG